MPRPGSRPRAERTHGVGSLCARRRPPLPRTGSAGRVVRLRPLLLLEHGQDDFQNRPIVRLGPPDPAYDHPPTRYRPGTRTKISSAVRGHADPPARLARRFAWRCSFLASRRSCSVRAIASAKEACAGEWPTWSSRHERCVTVVSGSNGSPRWNAARSERSFLYVVEYRCDLVATCPRNPTWNAHRSRRSDAKDGSRASAKHSCIIRRACSDRPGVASISPSLRNRCGRTRELMSPLLTYNTMLLAHTG